MVAEQFFPGGLNLFWIVWIDWAVSLFQVGDETGKTVPLELPDRGRLDVGRHALLAQPSLDGPDGLGRERIFGAWDHHVARTGCGDVWRIPAFLPETSKTGSSAG